jgi:hypothetical protein
MSSILWRVIIAVICVVVVFALIAPVFRVVGFNPSSDVLLILRVCIAGLALLYIVKGPPVFGPQLP